MWKIDNNSELNKLYKDIKINKYISELSDEDESEYDSEYESENELEHENKNELEKENKNKDNKILLKEKHKIINDLKNFIFEVVYTYYFNNNDPSAALYYFDPRDGVATTDYFYSFLTYTCLKYEYGFIDTFIKDTQIEYLYIKELNKDPYGFYRIVTNNDSFKKYYRIRMPFEHKI